MSTKKTKPNAPCPCGSGKKYKKCCFQIAPVSAGAGLKTTDGKVAFRELLSNANQKEFEEQMAVMKRIKNSTREDLERRTGVDPQQEELHIIYATRRDMLQNVAHMCQVLGISRDDWERAYDREHDYYLQEVFLDTVQASAIVKKMMRNNNALIDAEAALDLSTPMGIMRREEKFAEKEGYAQVFIDAMDRHLDDSCSVNIALDLASGGGVFPFEYTHRKIHSDNDGGRLLIWYPSEWRKTDDKRNPLAVLRLALSEKSNDNSVDRVAFRMMSTHGYRSSRARGPSKLWEKIFENPNTGQDFTNPDGFLGFGTLGMPLFPNQNVKLVGLSAKHFNQQKGIITGEDEGARGRIGVLLEGKSTPMSFKASNLLSLEAKSIANSLLCRSFELDLEDPRTWSNRVHGLPTTLHGKCAVVTCTSLLTQVGPRAPLMWQQAMEVSSLMLAPAGILLQHDTVKYGGFGETKKMREYVEQKNLGLELVECSEPLKIPEGANWGKLFLLVWRKRLCG